MGRRSLAVAAIVACSFAIVLLLFVHLSRRSDLTEDVLAAPASGDAALAMLHPRSTILRLNRTPVRHAGDVALRMSLHTAGPSTSAATVTIFDATRVPLATCRFARGSFSDTTVLRCGVPDLARVRRVRIRFDPKLAGAGVVGDARGVGTLLVPRSGSRLERLETILGRIGAKHPAPFSGWIVPIGTGLWLSALAFVGYGILRPPRPRTADEGRVPDER